MNEIKNEIKTDQLFLKYPPRIDYGTLQTTMMPQARGNQIACFCSTVKGERILVPDWGLPNLVFQSNISNGEIEAIILTNLKIYFPSTQIRVSCRDDKSVGTKICDIHYSDSEGTGTITIKL